MTKKIVAPVRQNQYSRARAIYKFNRFLSTLNFVLIFVGYALTTSLFISSSTNLEWISQWVTVPYRAFALFISLIVIILNFKYKAEKIPFALKMLCFFWIALIIRIFYDANICANISSDATSKLWRYIFGICLPAMYSVMKSVRMINIEKTLEWVYIGIILTLIISIFNNALFLMHSNLLTERLTANVAINSITLGHLGTTGVILSLFLFLKRGISLTKKSILIALMLLSFFVIITAGSRSPVVALAVIFLFWILAINKNVVLSVSLVGTAFTLLVVFIEPILNFIGKISPVMESRLKLSMYEQSSSGRDVLYEKAFDIFLNNPILGDQFALFSGSGGFIYSHNIILDALMGLGVMGGLSMLYFLGLALKKSYFLIRNNDPHLWIYLILIQQIVFNMFSGAFYYNHILNALLAFIFVYTNFGTSKKIENVSV